MKCVCLLPAPQLLWMVKAASLKPGRSPLPAHSPRRPRPAGNVEVPPELAQELLEASDQYMLEVLKRLCEQTISKQLAPDNVLAVRGQRGRGRLRDGRPCLALSGCWPAVPRRLTAAV